MANQRIYMQIKEGDAYWEGNNGASHPTHPLYWSEVREVTQEVKMDIDGVNSSGGPQASGRVDHSDMIVLKDVDRMTPRFYSQTCLGSGIDVILEVFDLTSNRENVTSVATMKPNFVYILRGVSITSQKITNNRTALERREYNLASHAMTSTEMLTGYTDIGWAAPFTIQRETLTFLYSDLFMEIFGGSPATSQQDGFWNATRNHPTADKPAVTVGSSHGSVTNGRFYSW